MIQYFIDMPIEKQTWTVLSVGWVMLVVSAAIRESIPAGECRNWARLMGVVGVSLMSLQTVHTTMLIKELNTELMVRRGTHDVEQTEAVATQISDPVSVVAVASEYTTTVGNQTFSIVRFTDGKSGSVYRAEKREDRIGAGRGAEVSSVRRCDDLGHAESPAADRMSDGTCGRRF
jgi:hypothetical protein